MRVYARVRWRDERRRAGGWLIQLIFVMMGNHRHMAGPA